MANLLQSLGSALNGKLGEKLNLAGGTMTGSLLVPDSSGAVTSVATTTDVTTLENAIGNFGDFVASTADVTVNVYDTESNILARTGDSKGAIGVTSDTQKVYIFNGSSWALSSVETIAADFQSVMSTLNIGKDTESNIKSRTGDAVGTMMIGSDTYDLYIYDGSTWHTYNNDA